MRRLAIYSVILAILAGLGYWWFSAEQVLKRRTESLLATLTSVTFDWQKQQDGWRLRRAVWTQASPK